MFSNAGIHHRRCWAVCDVSRSGDVNRDLAGKRRGKILLSISAGNRLLWMDEPRTDSAMEPSQIFDALFFILYFFPSLHFEFTGLINHE